MADNKITQLTAGTALTSDDVLPYVDDPGGTPVTKKITWANVLASIWAAIASITGKTTPVDADTFVISDSAASNVGKSVTWANIKSFFLVNKSATNEIIQRGDSTQTILNGNKYISATITYTTPFSGTPRIFALVQTASAISFPGELPISCAVYSVTSTNFVLVISCGGNVGADRAVTASWFAVGPQ